MSHWLILLFVCLLIATGCDSNGPALTAPEPPADSLILNFFQRPHENAEDVLVGHIVMPFTNPISLAEIPRHSLSVSGGGSYLYRAETDQLIETELIIFFVTDTRPSGTSQPSVSIIRVPPRGVGKNFGELSLTASNTDMIVYGFFIEGFGDTPTQPVEFTFAIGYNKLTFTLDPATHLLPHHYALHLTDNDFDLLDTPDDYLVIDGVTTTDPDPGPYTMFTLRRFEDNHPWRVIATRGPHMWSQFSQSTISEQFHYYLFLLDGFVNE